jgi:AAA+ ATPase superfamily predicted ATPase
VPKRYELSEVAAEYLPRALKDPERWLRRKLNARAFPGTRVGRHWVMTEEQVAAMLKLLGTEDEVSTPEPKPVEPDAASFLDGLSPRSRRRLKAVQ